MSPHLDDPIPASERFMDAALSEHARLGRDEFDDELVHRILCETVNRSGALHRVGKGSPRDWRMWMTVGGVAAALIALILVVLSTLTMDGDRRKSDDFRFLVGFSSLPKGEETSNDAPRPIRDTEPYNVPLALIGPAVQGNPDPSRLQGNFEATTTAEDLSFELPPSDWTWIRQENLRISADRSIASSGRLTYHGNVVIEHSRFRIEAREVILNVPGASGAGGSQALLAKEVKVTQQFPHRLAVAETLSFDPSSGTLTLTGVESFETSEGSLRKFAPGDTLVLNGERFTVETPPLIKYAAPPLVKP